MKAVEKVRVRGEINVLEAFVDVAHKEGPNGRVKAGNVIGILGTPGRCCGHLDPRKRCPTDVAARGSTVDFKQNIVCAM